MSRPLSVLALVPYPLDTTPSQRFRLEQWAPHLAQRGIDVDLVPFATRALYVRLYRPGARLMVGALLTACVLRRVRDILGARRYDVVVVHRAAALLGPPLLEAWLARMRPLIYDFDDAIFLLHTSANNRRLGWLKFPGKTARICRRSRHIVVGNEYLAAYARQHNPRVAIVPTSIDTNAYGLRDYTSRERVVIGWSGSATSQAHLEAFQPVLRRVVPDAPVEFRVYSDRPPQLGALPHTWTPWSPSVQSEVAELRRFHIGIMPMPDDPWARGKCGLKVLQYMAVGAATVSSPVGMNRELIRHGENGLLAATDDEWVACLRQLIADPPLRERLGRKGRQTVEQGFSAQLCAERFAGVVREVVG